MKKILKDIKVLREQGLRPHLWLQCLRNTSSGYTEYLYFDGYSAIGVGDCMADEIVETGYVNHVSLYIRPVDIANFSLASLEQIRKCNKEFYPTAKTIPADELLEGICEDEVLEDFFYYCTTLLGFIENEDWEETNGKPTCKGGRDKLILEDRTITYKEALETLYNWMPDLTNYEFEDYNQTGSGIYYAPPMELEELAATSTITEFSPTSYKINNTGGVELYSGKKLIYSCEPYVDYPFLAMYIEKLEGLRGYLEGLQVKNTAETLATGNAKILPMLKVYGGVYNYKETTIGEKHAIMYEMPDKGGILLETLSTKVLEMVYEELNQDGTKIQYSLLNVVELQPLFVSSMQFKEDCLDIMVQCAVSLGVSEYRFIDIPLVLIAGDIDKAPHDSITLLTVGHSHLRFPTFLLKYLNRNYELEEVLGEELLSNRITNQKYKAVVNKYW